MVDGQILKSSVFNKKMATSGHLKQSLNSLSREISDQVCCLKKCV